MTTVLVQYGLLLAAALFLVGLAGVLFRRNLLFTLLSLEIMLNAAGLAFVAAGARWGQADGQIFFMLILTLTAAEVAIGLALALEIHHRFRTLDADVLSGMKG